MINYKGNFNFRNDETPKTGTIDIISYVLVITLTSVAVIIVLKKKI